MKVPKATQLPSGSWFVRVRVDGKDISITRQTEKEAIAEAMAIKAGIKEEAKRAPASLTLREAIDEYIELREASLSPATIRGYVTIQNNRLQSVMDRTINKTTDKMYQQAVNIDAHRLSAKTVKNSWGLVSSVLKDIAGRDVSCSLPQIVKKEHLFLEPEQIPVFVKAIEGHRHELAMLLALHGLRASEIRDMTWADIDVNKKLLLIRGSAVPDRHNNLIHKETNKVSASRRDVPILLDRLITVVTESNKSEKYVFVQSSSSLYAAINRVCKKLDLPLIGTHGLRHTWTSLCFSRGLPEDLTMRLGGWSDFGTMRKIYTHLAARDVAKHTNALRNFFNPQNGNENDNAQKKCR